MKSICSLNLTRPSNTTRWYQWFFILFSFTLLASCGGSSSGGDGGGGTVTPGAGAKLEMQILNLDGQTTSTTEAGTNVNVQVTAKNDFGNRASGVTITYTTSIGSLSQDTALTNSNGVASVSLITTESQAGVATVTVSATVDGKELSLNDQVEITPFQDIPPSVNLTVYDEDCVNQVTSVVAGETICLKSSVFQQTTPYVNQVVEFSTTQGTPTPSSNITDNNGVASTKVTSTLDLLGASTITASTTIDGATYSSSTNIEYTAFIPEPEKDPEVLLTVLDASCVNVTNTAQATGSLCLSARLTLDGQPLANEIISFTAPVGSLRQAVGLTDNNGVFFTQLDSLLAETGAATAIATHKTFTNSKNYQFIPLVTNSANLTMTLKDSTCSVDQNQVEAGQSLCMQASLSNSNGPVVNAIVTFTAPLGQVSPETALTDSSGIAKSLITSTPTIFGAAIATASFDGETSSQNYQFNASTATTDTDLDLKVRDQFCENLTDDTVVGQTLCLHANLLENGIPQASKLITFAAPIGTLEPSSSLTNENGDAYVLLKSIETDIGAATATATYNESIGSANYEFLRGTDAEPTDFDIALKDSQCEQTVNAVPLGEDMCIEATLVNDSGDIAGKIVSFSATRGLLEPNSVLSDGTGLARTTLKTDNADLGAGIISVTLDNLTKSLNYQIVTANSTKQLTVKSFEIDCVTEKISFNAGSSFCLAAVLTDAGSPQANQIISFEIPIGTLRQTSALTNSLGIATAIVDTDNSSLGAGEAVVINANLRNTTNYELIASDPQNNDGPQLNVRTLQNGAAINRITAGETLEIEASLQQSDGQPINNTIIRFAAERGQLITDTALTDSTGIASVLLTTTEEHVGAGAATIQVDIEGVVYTQTYNYEVQSSGDNQQEITRIGYFDNDNNFVEGQIGISLQNDANNNGNFDLSAGGTMGLTVGIANQNGDRIISPLPVTFTSVCTANNNANLDAETTTVNGEARSTYEDINCSSTEGGQDTIIASINANNATLTASVTIDILPDALGSIEFVSADPSSIVLKGTGGQNKQESSVLTFRLRTELGNPASQQEVSFSLDSTVGGLTITPEKSFTNSQGLVTTRVTAGTVPAAVRVTATSLGNNNISTQSDLLSVNTGLPDQDSITLTTNRANPEAHSRSGTIVNITAYMADSFNNPVPDGTTINFTTEGGFIQPSCNTTQGTCTVEWRATNPRVADHRITILATAIGHETLYDVNGNNVFDDADTPNGSDDIHTLFGTDSGLTPDEYKNSGFLDHSEAWRDDNENRVHDTGEVFIDYNNDNTFNDADGKFNGPQCTHSTLCANEQNRKINVRKALVMIMSGSEVVYSLTSANLDSPVSTNPDFLNKGFVLATNDNNTAPNNNDGNIVVDGGLSIDLSGNAIATSEQGIILEEGQTIDLTIHIADNAQGLGQILPSGTTASISTTLTTAAISGTTEYAIPNSAGYYSAAGEDNYGGDSINFSIINTNIPDVAGASTQNGFINILVILADSETQFPISIPITTIGR